jgi:hypothetical protein
VNGAAVPVLAGLSTSSDNTNLMQAAISDGGFSLPAGVFPIRRALVPPLATTICGVGSYRSVIVQTTPGQPVIAGVDTVSRLVLSGVGITGPGKGNGNAPGIRLTREYSPNIFGLDFDDVVVQQCGGDGIEGSNVIVSTFNRVIAEMCGGKGFNLYGVEGGTAGTSVVANGCYGNAKRRSRFLF